MPTFTSLGTPAIGQQWTAATLSQVKDDLDFFRTPPKAYYSPSVAASNITTTSASYVDLTGFTITFTTQGGQVLLLFNARASVVTIRFDIHMDGVSISGDADGLGAPGVNGEVSIIRLVAPTAASHTFKVQWKTTSGTGTVYPAGLCQLIGWEVFLP